MRHIFQQKCSEQKLDFLIDIPDPFPIVQVDRSRIRQILFNLIGNAVKFTKKGSVTIRVNFCPNTPETSDTKPTGTLSISVIDTGIGISAKEQQRLFEPFVQSNAIRGTQAAINGTGLGLAIVSRMVEKMRGEITLQSELNHGSNFTIILRDVAYHQGPQPSSEPIVTEDNHAIISTINSPMLIVDDVEANLKVVSAMLKKFAIQVFTAHNAEQAWKILQKEPIKCVLTDLWMPGLNGADFAKEIRKSGQYSSLRIAAITADTENETNGRFDMSPFDAILIKPITRNDLYEFLLRSESDEETP